MKVFAAFVIFTIAAVFGQEEEISDNERRVYEMLKQASTACRLEMKTESSYINSVEYAKHSDINVDACLTACVDRKMGVVNDDGTYNLERILSYTESPQLRKKIVDIITKRIKYCNPLVGTSPCKLSACIHGMPECAFTDVKCT